MKNKILLCFLAFLAFAISAASQTYVEEPSRVPGGGPYVTKYAHLDGKQMRSFTYRYDTEKHIALWVAYPLNAGLIGSGSRGEEWIPDTSIHTQDQPTLYKGFSYGSGYDRGHQIPSADRLDKEANQQTFTFTNATPQLHDFNGGIWAELEKLVRTWAKRSDTLYVVTGVIPGDAFIKDNDGKPVNIPSAYYKAVLRRNSDRFGKIHWSVCSVFLPHYAFPVGTWQENANFFRHQSLPLSVLEENAHETFFPILKDIIGEDAYKQLKKTNPANESWWWK